MTDTTHSSPNAEPPRTGFRSRLAGLQRQVAQVRTYAAKPWVQIGGALAVGYLLGRRERTSAERRAPETITHALIRTALVTLATSAIQRALREQVELTIDVSPDRSSMS